MGCRVRQLLCSLRARVLLPTRLLLGWQVSLSQWPSGRFSGMLPSGGHGLWVRLEQRPSLRLRESGPTEAAMAKVTPPPAMLKGSAQLGNHRPCCPVTGPTAGPIPASEGLTGPVCCPHRLGRGVLRADSWSGRWGRDRPWGRPGAAGGTQGSRGLCWVGHHC